MIRWAHRSALALVVAVGAALRCAALDYGEDIDVRPDEPGVALATILHAQAGTVAPPMLVYGTGYVVPMAALVRATRTAPAGATDAATQQRVKVLCRGWSAVLGTLTIPLVALTAGRVHGRAAGILAALLVAVSPLAVREAHAAKADTAAAFTVALVMAAATHTAWTVRRAAGVGLATALCIATKWGVAVVPGVLVALLRATPAPRTSRATLWTAAAAAMVTGLVIATVPLATASTDSWHWARELPTLLRAPDWHAAIPDPQHPLAHHALTSLPAAFGVVGALLLPPALVAAALRPNGAMPLAWMAVGVLGLTMSSRVALARYVLSAVPPGAVLIASASATLVAALPRRMRPLAACVLLAALVAPPSVDTARWLTLVSRTDTRSLARDWLAAHVPAGSEVLTVGGLARLPPFGRPPMPGLVPRTTPVRLDALPGWLVWDSYPIPYSEAPRPPLDASWVLAAQFDPFSGRGTPTWERADAVYLPIRGLDGVTRPGPRIEIWRREAHPMPRAHDTQAGTR